MSEKIRIFANESNGKRNATAPGDHARPTSVEGPLQTRRKPVGI